MKELEEREFGFFSAEHIYAYLENLVDDSNGECLFVDLTELSKPHKFDEPLQFQMVEVLSVENDPAFGKMLRIRQNGETRQISFNLFIGEPVYLIAEGIEAMQAVFTFYSTEESVRIAKAIEEKSLRLQKVMEAQFRIPRLDI